jgi:GT2 family glycosyltransferase
MTTRKLTKNDICIIIPTYNRAEDMSITLKSIIQNKNIPGRIVVTDQSKDDKTRNVIENYKKILPLEYIHCEIPSTNISVNIALKKYHNKYKLILTMADDVDLLENYLDEMLKEFNKNTKVVAIGGAEIEKPKENEIKKTPNDYLLSLFFLPHKTSDKFKIVGPYGNTHSPEINKPIRDAQWIPGFNTCVKSYFYKNYLWPKTRGYDVLSDIDSTYRIYKKYGEGSLVITPECKVHHRYSHVARYDDKKRIFVNHEDHFSYYYMHFYNFLGTFQLIWSLIGIVLGNTLRFAFKPNKKNFNALRYNLQSVAYSIKNRKNIRNKKYRIFLNNDLSMKF